ncbi:MAG: hypothetical protein JW702_11620 [Clostridiales bacterium]|nr:hypothetical protein [Clostridiales bacterium]
MKSKKKQHGLSVLFVLFFYGFLIIHIASAYSLKSAQVNNQTTLIAQNDSLIIKGILVDNDERPMRKESMTLYISNSETTLDTQKVVPKKSGLGEQIKGTGTLTLKIEGVKDGGAIKLIDGRVANPRAITDEKGNFQFNASPSFIDNESEFIIAVDFTDYRGTLSYPLIDEEGNVLILKKNHDRKIINLGKIKILKK